jgi:prepilin-type N-terminal cleavage/methylation domain-containing protein
MKRLKKVSGTQRAVDRKKSTAYRLPRTAYRCGFGLVELLVALSISATLLVATGMAVHASLMAYQVNQEQATLMNRCRVTLHRMLGEIRCTMLHQPLHHLSDFQNGQIIDDTGLSMYPAGGASAYTYSWDADTQQLTCQIGSGSPHVLLDGVESFNIKLEPMKSPGSVKCDLLKRATITMTVHTTSSSADSTETTGNQTVTLSSSVMPRRNVWVGQKMSISIATDRQLNP